MEARSRKHKIPVMPQITVNVDTLNAPTTRQGRWSALLHQLTNGLERC